LVVAVAVAAAACSATSSTTGPFETTGEFPVTIQAPNGPVTLDQRPTRIVSLSPTATEVLFAIGAGEQVVAVDDQSNFPEEAPVTDLSGLEPNIEAIAALDADLVVMMFDVGGETVAALDAIGIPAVVHPAAEDLDDAYTQIEQLGVATGNVADAAAMVASIEADIDRIVTETDAGGGTYYYELDPTFFTATSHTFIGGLYAMLSLVNIADDAEDPGGAGYPQLSAEHIIAEDPDFVYLADTKCCAQNAAAIADRPGWSTMTAVRSGAVIELDDDVASRWGPRIVDLMEAIAASVAARVGT